MTPWFIVYFSRLVVLFDIFFEKIYVFIFRWKPFLSTLKIWKQNIKILFLPRFAALWKWYVDFQLLYKKCWRQQNYGNMVTNWYIFQKLLSSHGVLFTAPNFVLLAFPIQRYRPQAKMTPTPPRTYTDPKKHRLNE